jgi:MYXO-CTERM domain-containing protein
MLRFSSLMATAIAVPVVSLFGTTTASADVILQEFELAGNSLRMTISGTLPSLVYGDQTQIRIRAEDSSDWMPSNTERWLMSNESAFSVTNGSDVASVSRIDAQANSGDQIVIFFDRAFATGGVVSGTVEFTLGSGYGDWNISPTTTFRISSTMSSGVGIDLFTGVTASYSTPVVPGPAAIAALAGLGTLRRRRR